MSIGAPAEGHGAGGDGEDAPAAHRPARSASARGGEAGAILTMQQIMNNPIQYQLESVILGAKSWLGELSVPVALDRFSVSVPAPREEAPQSLYARLRSVVCGQSWPARMVLENITTHFEPGRMCLVVGGPQCGKSTLLRAIADRLPRECKQHGEARINGHARSGVSPGYVRQVLGYVPPTDEHVPVLTVEETLSFAYDLTCSTYAEKLRKQTSISVPPGTQPKVHLLLHLFGLSSCRQTRIGDSRVRGVSGGEKKRVTVAEQLVRTYPVCCMDEISTGLDAKVTLDIITALRTEVGLLKTTRIIALLQPPPAVYELFDDILLLGVGGRLVYHGPLQRAGHYFAELGLLCPANVDMLEFLVDVCNENGAQYYHVPAAADSDASAATPRRWLGAGAPDSAALSDLWRASSMGAQAVEQARASKDAVCAQAAAERGLGVGGWLGWVESSEDHFGSSWARSLQVLTVRHATILWRDVIFVRQRLLQAFMQASLLGIIFWQAGEPRHGQAGSESGGSQDGQTDARAAHTVLYRDHVKMAVIFLVCGVQMTSSISILEVINAKRPLFYKLRDAQFFPTLVYTLSEGFAELPLQLVVCPRTHCPDSRAHMLSRTHDCT
jgi:ABC-type multidrug transport system ATPase subunit